MAQAEAAKSPKRQRPEPLLTTVIGAFPKPAYLDGLVGDWFTLDSHDSSRSDGRTVVPVSLSHCLNDSLVLLVSQCHLESRCLSLSASLVLSMCISVSQCLHMPTL